MCSINKHIRPWTLLLALKQTLAFFLMPKEIKLDIKNNVLCYSSSCESKEREGSLQNEQTQRMNKPRGGLIVGRCRQISRCRLTARFLTGPAEPGLPAMFLARRCRLQLNFKRGVIKKKLPLGVRMLMISAWRNYKYTRPEREREREQ